MEGSSRLWSLPELHHNYFFGLSIDRWNLSRQVKEITSWSMLAAGLIGVAGRPVLVLVSALDTFGI